MTDDIGYSPIASEWNERLKSVNAHISTGREA
jgi:hypothetical protein